MTKKTAAFATARGIDVHITYGRNPENLYRIMDGETDPFQNLVNMLMSERYQPIYKAIQ